MKILMKNCKHHFIFHTVIAVGWYDNFSGKHLLICRWSTGVNRCCSYDCDGKLDTINTYDEVGNLVYLGNSNGDWSKPGSDQEGNFMLKTEWYGFTKTTTIYKVFVRLLYC